MWSPGHWSSARCSPKSAPIESSLQLEHLVASRVQKNTQFAAVANWQYELQTYITRSADITAIIVFGVVL